MEPYVLVLFLIGLLIFGILLGGLISFGFTSLNKMSEEIPIEVARQLRDNFKVNRLMRLFAPGTRCVVHDYNKLMAYLNEANKQVFEASDLDGKIKEQGYKTGIAIYFGKTFRQDCIGKKVKNNGKADAYSCMRRKSYTVFLYPVLFKECTETVERRRTRIMPGASIETIALPDPVPIRILEKETFEDPFEDIKRSEKISDELESFRKRAYLFFNNKEQNPFDLGHTHP